MIASRQHFVLTRPTAEDSAAARRSHLQALRGMALPFALLRKAAKGITQKVRAA